MMKTNHVGWALGGLALAGGFAATGCQGSSHSKLHAEPETRTATASVLTVRREVVPIQREVTGTLRAQFMATLSSKVMSRVVRMAKSEGDSIARGERLVELDAREMVAAVRMASADLNAASIGVVNARTAAQIEQGSSSARIRQAEAALNQARSGLAAAQAQLDLAKAGPRTQEKAQARLAVIAADSNLRLAKTELERATRLFEEGATAKKNLEIAQNHFEVAQAQYDTAIESEKIAAEGTRSEELRAAQERVRVAEASVRQAEAGLSQARVAAMQTQIRRDEIRLAEAQTRQSAAALDSARVGLAYTSVDAPFAGRVTRRLVDPGAMAAPGVPLLEVEGGPVRLEANVPESLIPSIRKGMSVPIQVDALGDQEMTGTTVEIVPQGNRASRTFVVKFELESRPGLKSGMFGRAKLTQGRREQLLVPQSAVWEREGLHYTFAVNAEGIARLRILTLGERSGDRVVVLSGLSDGERIVVGDRRQVADGVRIQESR